MEDHKGIRTIYLYRDNDDAGEAACIHLNKCLLNKDSGKGLEQPASSEGTVRP
jgi:hypothetical protein